MSPARVFLGAVLLGLAGCLGSPVETDFDPEVDVGGLHWYAWTDSSGVDRRLADEYPFLERRLRRAVDRALETNGFASRGTDPDFLVSVVVLVPSPDRRRVRWTVSACGPFVGIRIGPTYPFGISRRGVWPRHPSFYRSPWGWGCGYRIGVGYVWVPMYDEPDARFGGTLVIDLLDPRTREPVWRARAPGAIIDLTGPGGQEAADEVVARVLRDLPLARR